MKQALQDELAHSQQTPEQRRAEIANRARKLGAAREAERQALAASLLEQQFREGCDLLRQVESEHKVHRVLDQRKSQVGLLLS